MNGWGMDGVSSFHIPKDFTPVCTTELGAMAKITEDFKKRNVKVLAISVDPIDSHKGWVKDINETQGCTVSYPIIADPEKKVANLYWARQKSQIDVDLSRINRPEFPRNSASG